MPPTESVAGRPVWRPDGRLVADVVVNDTGDTTVGAIRATGAEVLAVSREGSTVSVAINPAALPALGSLPAVRYVTEALAPKTNAICPSGTYVSEGVSQLDVATARTQFGVDGSGITVGILSDSYNVRGGAAADVVNAELPGTSNPCGDTAPVSPVLEGSGNDEGRAMGQIVHDVAPGASLSFATALSTQAQFAANIRALQAAGANVIVDDIGYFAEPMFQDGVIAQAINEVTAAGTSYFSAAGNANVVVGGKNVGSYEANYRPTSCPSQVATYVVSCQDFNPGAGTSNSDSITIGNGGEVLLSFGWNEPQFGIATDYDVFAIDDLGNVSSSAYDNVASGSAFEILDLINNSGSARTYRIVVGKYSGSGTPRFKFIMQYGRSVQSVQFNTSSGGDVIGPTIYGHSAASTAGSIGAIAYNTNSSPESFSSRGPASFCWAPVDGSNPAPPLSPCVTKQPDMVATDGGQNSFFGSGSPPRFYGTSAAAPHAAGVAALQLQARPCRTPAEVLAAQRASAVAVGSFDVSAVGAGRLQAPGAITNLAGCGASRFSVVADSQATVGQPASFTVTARDDANSVATSYGGTVQFTSTGPSGSLPASSTLVDGTGTFTATFSATGTATITATDTTDSSLTGTSGPITVRNPIGYHPMTPVRILESRAGFGPIQYNTPWGPGYDRPVQVTGNGVPSSATAVVLNVTAVSPTAPSDLRIYPTGQSRPNVSNLNFNTGRTIPNLVIARVGTGGKIQIYNNAGSVDVLADIVGWFDDGTANGDRYTSMTPNRILDSRPTFGGLQYSSPWQGGTDRSVQVLGNGVPADATAVVLNVTAVNPAAASDLRIYPSGQARPNASNLNFGPFETIPNLVIAQVGTGGNIQIFNNAGSVDVLADVVGYFLPAASGGTGYHAMSPSRILESRPGFGAIQYNTPWGPAYDRPVQVTGNGVPANATAVVLNVTAVGPTSASDLRIYPTGQLRPNTSNLNFTAGKTIPNLVIARVGTGGKIQIYNNAGSVNILADVVGYFSPA
ncbi:MAG: S8 family serine peptidase [Actinobacteria bacterium]|nr:S8 family serine peptidase [Actinomycetota bacterium]